MRTTRPLLRVLQQRQYHKASVTHLRIILRRRVIMLRQDLHVWPPLCGGEIRAWLAGDGSDRPDRLVALRRRAVFAQMRLAASTRLPPNRAQATVIARTERSIRADIPLAPLVEEHGRLHDIACSIQRINLQRQLHNNRLYSSPSESKRHSGWLDLPLAPQGVKY